MMNILGHSSVLFFSIFKMPIHQQRNFASVHMEQLLISLSLGKISIINSSIASLVVILKTAV